MGRYYKIEIEGGPTWETPQGDSNSALQVDLDIPVGYADAALAGAYVRVWGPGIQVISQSTNYVGKKCTVTGGMSKGLPLVNPAQRGQLSSGIIWQAFGNWEATVQTLDLVFIPGGQPPTTPGPNPPPAKRNLVLDWKKGQKLSEVLQSTIKTAFPNVNNLNIKISDKVVAATPQVAYFESLQEMAHWVRRYTQQLVPNYEGAGISMPAEDTINVVDDTSAGNGPTINYQDLIGQPTWIAFSTMQFKTVMRGDIHVNDTVTLPMTLIGAVPGGAGSSNRNGLLNNLTFSGSVRITKIRHVGASRQPDAAAWVTVFEALVNAS
jgi:hypothetical protein